jgi:hypothetical protein
LVTILTDHTPESYYFEFLATVRSMPEKMSAAKMGLFYQASEHSLNNVGLDRLLGDPEEGPSAIIRPVTDKKIEKRPRPPSPAEQHQDGQHGEGRRQDKNDTRRREGGSTRDAQRGDSRSRHTSTNNAPPSKTGGTFCFKDFRDAYGLTEDLKCEKGEQCPRMHLLKVPRFSSVEEFRNQARTSMSPSELEALMKKVRYDQPRFRDDLGSRR